MGVSAQHHRVTTGTYNSKFLVFNRVNIYKSDTGAWKYMLLASLTAVGLLLYVYILCLTMAMYIDCVNSHGRESPPLKLLSSIFMENSLYNKDLLNNMFLFFLPFFIKEILLVREKLPKTSLKQLYKNIKNYGIFICLSYIYIHFGLSALTSC